MASRVVNCLSLTFRHVQGLVHLIGEECVFLHLPGEGSAAYQVRVEKQGISLRVGGLPVIVDAADLPRGDEHECPFLVVVPAAPVCERPVYLLFQEDGIEAETFAAVLQHLYFLEVHKCHQRVQGLEPEEGVVVVYCLQIQYFSHSEIFQLMSKIRKIPDLHSICMLFL